MVTVTPHGGQTKAREYMPTFRLPIMSPYFQRVDFEEGRRMGRDTSISTTMKAIFTGFFSDVSGVPSVPTAMYQVSDSTGQPIDFPTIYFTGYTGTSTYAQLRALADAAFLVYATGMSYGMVQADIEGPTDGFVTLASMASSYQTIVTQTGTSAPAVSGSLSPVSTYPAGTTFTWARTGAGVYTLTASTAVFNTSGKTGVFVGSLNNPNGAWKAIVTSSTVVTLTTYLQSLAVLGLLGFTGTPTDALLTQTMVYVQTYA